MAASTVQNPTVAAESKSAKKKKAKAEAAAAAAVSTKPDTPSADSTNGEGSDESPYLKELHKSIRSIKKKITNASKVDNILEENPGKTLDDLVAAKKINPDQKRQILNKPSLEAALAQYEEQVQHYQKFDQEAKARADAKVARVEKDLTDKHNKELEEAVAKAKAEVAEKAQKERDAGLLTISQFLRLAAAKRQEEADAELDLNQALEGVLVEVYTGDETSVVAMDKLVQGSDEKAPNVEGEKLNVTYREIKDAANAFVPAGYEVPAEVAVEESHEVEHKEVASYPVGSDPTVANAGLTELNDTPTSVLVTECDAEGAPGSSYPKNSGFGDGANAAAEDNWDRNNDLSASQDEWVDVRMPRDAAETETGVEATPAAMANTQSWADEQPDAAAKPQQKGDGFNEVRGGRGNGNYRGGRGGRGDGHRGRGGYRGRGNGEGRGRGHRGNQNRGPRQQEA